MNLYLKQGNKNYNDFSKILSKYEVNTSDIFKVFAKVQDIGCKDLMKQFDQGCFISSDKEKVEKFFEDLNDFRLFKYYKTTQFVGAFLNLYFQENYSHSKMKQRLSKRGSYLKKRGTINEYLEMLTKDIYSFGAVKNPIYYDAQTKKFYK